MILTLKSHVLSSSPFPMYYPFPFNYPRLAMLLIALLFPSLARLAETCAATVPTTTPSPTTACRTCAQNLITLTQNVGGSHAFMSDTTSTTGACNVRTLVCDGPNANIEINGGDGVINDADDGATDGIATLQVTCNAANTAWEYMGVAITQAECASGIIG